MFEASPQALEDLDRIAGELRIDLILVGAGARILVFDRPFGYRGRATMDWDVGVRLESWPEFDRLVKAMTLGEGARFRLTDIEHRFAHVETEQLLDIVPFGGIARPDRTIRWPGDKGTEMNVVGFEEALACAERVPAESIALENMKVVALPGLVVLKLIAWSDRRAKKDLEDIASILKQYQDWEAIYEKLPDELERGEVDEESAGAYLLGREICQLFEESLKDVVGVTKQILDGADSTIPSLVDRRLEGGDWDAEFDRLAAKFEALLAGMES